MNDRSPVPMQRLPFVIISSLVVVAAIVAVAVGVDHASTAVAPPTPTAAPTPTPAPPPAIIPFADCSTAKFGATLAPLSPPANLHTYTSPPALSINLNKLYEATITTRKGAIVLCLQPDLAPQTVNNFVVLARNHYYDGIPFHRIVAKFVDQAGDPNCIGHVPPAPATPGGGCGRGGPGYAFKDEPVHQSYALGVLAMANSGPNTNGSQFFICIADVSKTLQPKYNLFGRVAGSMSVALNIAQGDVMESVTVRQQQ